MNNYKFIFNLTGLGLSLRELSKYKYLPDYKPEAAVIDYFNMA